jgi:hypothetical protein
VETRLTLRPGQSAAPRSSWSATASVWCAYVISTTRKIVAVRIAFHETDLRERAKRLGAVWRPVQKLWELTWRDAKRLGIAERVRDPDV